MSLTALGQVGKGEDTVRTAYVSVTLTKEVYKGNFLVISVAQRWPEGPNLAGDVQTDQHGNVWRCDNFTQRGGTYAGGQWSSFAQVNMPIGTVITIQTSSVWQINPRVAVIDAYSEARYPNLPARIGQGGGASQAAAHTVSIPLNEDDTFTTVTLAAHGANSSLASLPTGSGVTYLGSHSYLESSTTAPLSVHSAVIIPISASMRSAPISWSLVGTAQGSLPYVVHRRPRRKRAGVGRVWNGFYWDNAPARFYDPVSGKWKEKVGAIYNQELGQWVPSRKVD